MIEENNCQGGRMPGLTIFINPALCPSGTFILMRNSGFIDWIKVEEEKFIGVVHDFSDLVFCLENQDLVRKRMEEMEREPNACPS